MCTQSTSLLGLALHMKRAHEVHTQRAKRWNDENFRPTFSYSADLFDMWNKKTIKQKTICFLDEIGKKIKPQPIHTYHHSVVNTYSKHTLTPIYSHNGPLTIETTSRFSPNTSVSWHWRTSLWIAAYANHNVNVTYSYLHLFCRVCQVLAEEPKKKSGWSRAIKERRDGCLPISASLINIIILFHQKLI